VDLNRHFPPLAFDLSHSFVFRTQPPFLLSGDWHAVGQDDYPGRAEQARLEYARPLDVRALDL
jgi:hypothetical protein